MRCEEIRPLLSAGLDGELDRERNERLEQHLRGCALCAAERQALSATVRLLRALPEADPPLELRGRIAMALTEAHRRSERRWHHLGWLARPQAAGWAWGAALGAVIATGGLIATHRPATSPTAVVATSPVSVPVAAPAATPPAQPPRVAETPPKKMILAEAGGSNKTDAGGSEELVGETIQNIPAPIATPPAGPPALKSPATSLAPAPTKKPHSRPSRAPTASDRQTVQAALRAGPSTPAADPSRSLSRPGRVESASDEGTTTAPADTQPAPDPGSQDETMPSISPGTSGMTQMASGVSPMDTPAVLSDDLVELRRRLIDRPLQVPELGVMKPSSSAAPSSEGWIRF